MYFYFIGQMFHHWFGSAAPTWLVCLLVAVSQSLFVSLELELQLVSGTRRRRRRQHRQRRHFR